MEAPLFSTVLKMLADIPCWYPIIKDLIMDVSVGQVLKGLPYLHLPLWLLSNVCYTDRLLFLSLSGSGGGNSNIYVKVYQQCLKKWAGWCAQQGVPDNAISAPKLANFWYIYFRLAWPGLAYHWYTLFCYFYLFGASLSSQGI